VLDHGAADHGESDYTQSFDHATLTPFAPPVPAPEPQPFTRRVVVGAPHATGSWPMKIPFPAVLAALGALLTAGCGGSKTPAENSAAALDNAARQSTPEAAGVLNRAASDIRDNNVSDPNAAQAAMQAAGNAQAAAKAPAQAGAKPHAAGDPVPPPKLRGNQAAAGSATTQDQGPR
jgi:hypothetical protein